MGHQIHIEVLLYWRLGLCSPSICILDVLELNEFLLSVFSLYVVLFVPIYHDNGIDVF